MHEKTATRRFQHCQKFCWVVLSTLFWTCFSRYIQINQVFFSPCVSLCSWSTQKWTVFKQIPVLTLKLGRETVKYIVTTQWNGALSEEGCPSGSWIPHRHLMGGYSVKQNGQEVLWRKRAKTKEVILSQRSTNKCKGSKVGLWLPCSSNRKGSTARGRKVESSLLQWAVRHVGVTLVCHRRNYFILSETRTTRAFNQESDMALPKFCKNQRALWEPRACLPPCLWW